MAATDSARLTEAEKVNGATISLRIEQKKFDIAESHRLTTEANWKTEALKCVGNFFSNTDLSDKDTVRLFLSLIKPCMPEPKGKKEDDVTQEEEPDLGTVD